VLNAGSEPRTVLRLHPVVGDQQAVNLTMNLATSMTAADQAMPATVNPPITLTMEVRVKDVATNGDITYETVYRDATAAAETNGLPGAAAVAKASLASLSGMTGVGRISDRGISEGLEMALPAGADPQLNQAMDQLKFSLTGYSTALPEEAVGIGARWEYKNRLQSQGMTIDQTVTCELVAIEGDRLTLRRIITQNAENQKIQSPALPGLPVDLNKMIGLGTGRSTFDLTHLIPVTGTLDEKSETILAMNLGPQRQILAMQMNLNLTLETK
jgi:hypothetical protein